MPFARTIRLIRLLVDDVVLRGGPSRRTKFFPIRTYTYLSQLLSTTLKFADSTVVLIVAVEQSIKDKSSAKQRVSPDYTVARILAAQSFLGLFFRRLGC